jgi:hypothetical protein
MHKCRSCGADIRWIKTPAGNVMPCEADPILYWDGYGGNVKIVTQTGGVVTGTLDQPSLFDFDVPPKTGYIPHWANCPNAKKHRSVLR